jgi:hypothetical protein
MITGRLLHRIDVMQTYSRIALYLLITLALFELGTLATADEPVQQTAFNRPAPADAQPLSVRFGRHSTRVGDETEQTVVLEMRLALTMRRANEVIGKNQSTVRTQQRRIVTTTAVEVGRTMAVRVHYAEATKQVVAAETPHVAPTSDDATAGAAAIAEYQPVPQPVQGKTYLCHREPGENGKLIVTDEAGHRPPTEEYDIVAQQMDIVGRPNPFAQFLAGRMVTVGDTLELPKELARQIFNLGEKFGEATRFTLTLQKVEAEDGANCAVFLANVEAKSNGASQMLLQVDGPLAVQVDTCRATRINLEGPIGMSESRGSYSTAHQVIGTGHLRMNIACAHRDARR